MEFENRSRYERIDMMRKRLEWLSKLARICKSEIYATHQF